ncbi:MAG: agmatine deiminase family protein [Acidobacteria bacterium]|nr:agmatine deiminase family protein [Acidobacteriota bacterium]
MPGFRASPDDSPLRALHVSVDSLALLSGRKERVGDSLDVAREVLPKLERPLEIQFSLAVDRPAALLQSAIRREFPDTLHKLAIQTGPPEDFAPWVQDILKPGEVSGRERILVTHRLFEGSPELGQSTLQTVRSFQNGPYSASKLSWEGGDLQFARDPRDSTKLLLFYGDSAKGYWGEDLTNEEYAYVLQSEFGADEAIALGEHELHVDYLAALLPGTRTVLVSQPQCDGRAAGALLQVLEAAFPGIPAELAGLRQLVRKYKKKDWPEARVRGVLAQARASVARWPHKEDTAGLEAINAYARQHCPGDPKRCISGLSLQNLIDNHAGLLASWVTMAARRRMSDMLPARIIDAIEIQVLGCRPEQHTRARERAAVLSQLGFRVINVPWIPGANGWAGISYANSAAIGRSVFMPEFGLITEEALYESIRSQLPSGTQLVPIPARFLMLMNGGIHCALAFSREPTTQSP